MRLIDADALENELCEVIRKRHRKRTVLALYMLLDIISNRSTIEAEPIKHGKWNPIDLYCNHAKEFRCSVCTESVFYDYYTRFCDYNYCPNCGAKMDSSEVR